MDKPVTIPPSVSVTIPVFNSEGTIGELVSRLEAVLSQVTTGWEIILVNDGSRDRSWQRIETLSASNSRCAGST